MSWFLRSHDARKRKSRPSSVRSPRPWDPLRTLAAVKLLLVLAVAGGAGYGWQFSREALRDYARRRAPVAVSAQDVVLADAPGWMNDPLAASIRDLVAAEIHGRPLDAGALGRAVGALRQSPWVELVSKIEQRSLNQVIVHASYRRPVALVEGRDGYHLVDAHGMRLPGLYSASQWRSLRLPLIVGQASAPGPLGKPWPGEDLRAGLALVAQLAPTGLAQHLEAIDVSGRDERGRVQLVLWTGEGRDRRRSAHIVWGLTPHAETPYEPDAGTKINRLAAVLSRRGAQGKIIDISGAAVWQREPVGGDVIRSAEYTEAW